MPRATLPGVGNKSLCDQRMASPHKVRNSAAMPTGLTIRQSNESGSPKRAALFRGADVDLCSTETSAPALFILIRLPGVGLDRGLISHKRGVSVILEMGRAVENAGLAPELFDFLKVRFAQCEVGVLHAVGRFTQNKCEQTRILIVIELAHELRRL